MKIKNLSEKTFKRRNFPLVALTILKIIEAPTAD